MHNQSPVPNSAIPHPFSARNLEGKIRNKTALQEKCGWPPEPKQPLLCLPLGMTDACGGKLFASILPGLLELPVALLIRGKGGAAYGTLFSRLAQEHPHRIAIMENTERTLAAMVAAADMALFCATTDKALELPLCLKYGVIPIAPQTDTLQNYNPNQECGNAFLYKEGSPWQCFAAIVHACETFRFPFDWQSIQKEAMRIVNAS